MTADDVISERDATYGDYATLATLSQSMKDIWRGADGWHRLTVEQKESLDLIAVKIARILNGDPSHADSWIDLEGYARLGRPKAEGVDKS